MRYLKILGAAFAAAAALAAIVGAGAASADEVCTVNNQNPCPAGSRVTTLQYSLLSGTKAILAETDGTIIQECTSMSLHDDITGQGSGTSVHKSHTTPLTWGGCTLPQETIKVGGGRIDNSGGSNGTDTDSGGIETTINTIFFGSCVYGTSAGTDFGTLDGGANARLTINAVLSKISGSSFACPSTVKWIATVPLTNHSAAYVINN